MIKSIRISVASALLVMSSGSLAIESSLGVKDLPKLTQESQHVAAASAGPKTPGAAAAAKPTRYSTGNVRSTGHVR